MKKANVKSIIGTSLSVIVLTAVAVLAGIADTQANAETYVESGRYHTKDGGIVVTSKRNFEYTSDVFEHAFVCTDGSVMFTKSEYDVRENAPVLVRVSDMGTPDYYGDDEALKVGFDFDTYMDEVIAANDAYIAELQAKYGK